MYFPVCSFWTWFYAASQKVVNFLRFALGHSTKLQLQYWWVYTAHHKCYLLASTCDRFSTYHYEFLGSSHSHNPQIVKQGILLYDAFMFETTYCLYFWHRLCHLPNENFFSSRVCNWFIQVDVGYAIASHSNGLYLWLQIDAQTI